MKPVRLSEDVVPIAEFKGQAAQWLRRVGETQQPVVITQNGKPAAVLLSPAAFDELMERQRFLESVAAGLEDADAGRTMDTDAVRRRLAARRPAGR